MKTMILRSFGVILLATWTLGAAEPMRVMILDGESAGAYHGGFEQLRLVEHFLQHWCDAPPFGPSPDLSSRRAPHTGTVCRDGSTRTRASPPAPVRGAAPDPDGPVPEWLFSRPHRTPQRAGVDSYTGR